MARQDSTALGVEPLGSDNDGDVRGLRELDTGSDKIVQDTNACESKSIINEP